ncbi:AraC family transcriptional regulator [Polluticaenibacter yanchengensis]|uniref:AraC family transcriptional regulator n=1 Tax=Polluticaenibacter yanchengensis TaxID=3014562 RepID=A0ABT4UM68_9BACT|nr:AraC family transcriptional regulator [Chitinophagaceae bacterium LY-5]
MKKAYNLLFEREIKSFKNVLNQLPTWCRYPLSAAKEATLYELSYVKILTQQLNLRPFLIDLVEQKASAPFILNFEVLESQVFFYFMLEGEIKFTDQNGIFISNIKANNFYISYSRPGIFNANVEKGDHIALIVSIDTEWIYSISSEFEVLKKFLDEFINLSQNYAVMPLCRMDKQVHRWLREIYTFTRTNKGALDGLLRLYISLALEYYNKTLKEREGMMAYRLKKYLDEHYCDIDLDYIKLTKIFYATERTLRNQFKAEFHITIHNYYTNLRLEKARYMITDLGMQIKDVYMEVGYKDESSFRYAYNKFINKYS